jgi:glycerol-3-phosphate dehydrogenase (NAD(P)+)
MAEFRRISVLGAGAWGSALADAAARTGRAVTLHGRNAEAKAAAADAILLVVPTQALRGLMQTLAPALRDGIPLLACSKGIERESGKFVTEIIAECAPRVRPAILSGPGFAADVARGLPTAVTLAASDERLAAGLAGALRSSAFRVYHSTDVRGVEIGGAAKNVLAIAAGIVIGRRLGASAQAATITRGFAELIRFGQAYGARMETLTGLSGLGDLVLTCTSPQSRNYSLGLALGEGQSLAAASAGKLVEGIFTASALVRMARDKNISVPIAEAVDDILSARVNIDEAIARLLSRPTGAEA